MRNLKRALSLALAFVMVMSLMIVGTSAKSYTDADKIDNQVAVEILGELGVMIGNDDGSFAPDRDVTRAEMAVLITRILYGNNMNVDQFKGLNTFTDVPDWAEGFVNLCASLDIIAGRGNGIFDPDATVTTAEAALMLSRALGYFKNNAEFGNDWSLAAMKRATQAGIIGGDMVLQANAGLDRDDVAQMTFNTLTKAVPVQYNELLDVYYNVNQGIIYALEFNYLQTLGFTNFGLVYKNNEQTIYGRPATTWGIGSYKDAGNGTASGIEKADLTDAGGLIASNVRMLDKDKIITVANTPDYVYTQDTAEKDVYNDLGATLCNDAKGQKASEEYDWTAFINGKEVKAEIPEKNESDDYTYTDKGAVVEIYVDDYDQTVTVVEINYYLGQVTKVDEDDDTITVKELSPEPTLNDDTFATTEFAEDDYVVFTVDFNDDDDYYICELMAPETATGDVVRVDNDNNSSDTYIRLDSKTGDKHYYTSEDHMAYDVTVNGDSEHPALNEEYTLYMTPAGYVLGFEPTAESVDQYLYVMDSDENLRDWTAKVVLPDATQPKVELDEDLDNTSNSTAYPFDYTENTKKEVTDATIGDTIDWFANSKNTVDVDTKTNNPVARNELDLTNVDFLIWNYSVNSSDVYSLEYVPYVDNGKNVDGTYQSRMYNAEINKGDAYVESLFNNTYFIIDKQTTFVDTMNDKVYTGYNEVPNIENATLAYVVEDGVAEIVYILDGEIYDENSTYFFLTSDKRETEEYDGDKYWEYEDAYVNGKNEKVLIAYDALYIYEGDGWTNVPKNALMPGVLYKATKSVDEIYITEVKAIGGLDVTGAGANMGVITTPQYVGDDAFSVTDSDSNLFKYTTDDDTVFVKVEREPKDIGAYEKAIANKVPYTGDFKWSVSTGRISDMNDSRLEDYVQTYVTVAEADKNVAELVYIYQLTPNYVGEEFTVTVHDGVQADVTKPVINGGTVTINYTAPAGYHVVSVDKGTYADGKITLTNVTADTTINVKLAENADATVNLDIYGSAVVTLNGKNYAKDATLDLVKGETYIFNVGFTTSGKVYYGTQELAALTDGSYYFVAEDGVDLTVIAASEDAKVKVAADGTDLQNAIDTATVNTIILGEGTYNVNTLAIDDANRDVSIIGVPGETTIVTTTSSMAPVALNVLANDVTLTVDGVTFQSSVKGEGIAIQDQYHDRYSGFTFKINNCTFKDYNYAVQLIKADASYVTNCAFEGNKMDISVISPAESVTISGNTYSNATYNVELVGTEAERQLVSVKDTAAKIQVVEL